MAGNEPSFSLDPGSGLDIVFRIVSNIYIRMWLFWTKIVSVSVYVYATHKHLGKENKLFWQMEQESINLYLSEFRTFYKLWPQTVPPLTFHTKFRFTYTKHKLNLYQDVTHIS